MHIDEEGLFSLAQQEIMDQITPFVSGRTCIDAFCGVGGSAIGLARAGKRVTTIDLNAARLEMAKYNAELFGVQGNVEFVCGDSLEILRTLSADCIFLDPPWGGPDYSKEKKFTLKNFVPDGRVLLELAFERAPQVIIRLPKNFDMAELNLLARSAVIRENFLHQKLMHYTAYFS